jgi:hypothetical protein
VIAHYTIVYRVDGDKAVHDAWWQSIQPLFLAESEPVSISMVSKADEVARLDGITRVVEGGMTAADKVQAIEAILARVNPENWAESEGV